MTNSDEIVEAEFVRLILRGELDRIKEAFEKFASHQKIIPTKMLNETANIDIC